MSKTRTRKPRKTQAAPDVDPDVVIAISALVRGNRDVIRVTADSDGPRAVILRVLWARADASRGLNFTAHDAASSWIRFKQALVAACRDAGARRIQVFCQNPAQEHQNA